ncbi:MAG: M23 family metallopeptidase [Piscinibacter sp.]|nr:M23 family metallopeptidase [Piscinibacter sp.]
MNRAFGRPEQELKSLVSLERRVGAGLAGLARFVSAHPRSLAAAVALSLTGFGATAWGIATQGPDPADLPRRLVTEMVTPEDVQSQLEALAEHELELYRSDLTRSSDTADSLLARLGVSDAEAAAFLRRDPVARRILEGRAGKMVRAVTGESGALTELVARYAPTDSKLLGTHFTRLTVKRDAVGLTASVDTDVLARQVRLGSGTIQTSLFAATDEARIPDGVASQLAEVFSTDVDFHRELRKGDTFSVVYEALTADGEPITWSNSSGRVLAAEFVNKGRSLSAAWFTDENGKGGYYDLDGRSKRRAFLASPMAFSRVTSGFAMRMHPILNQWRQHKGVDYGAPKGTPVRTVGDGVVEFAGWQNGYGNVVEIKHSNDRSTVYAHLSRIDVRRGQRVEQGTNIGAVGATGWATGPHLHFEVKVRGEQRNPITIAQTSEAIELTEASRPRFAALAASLRGQLDAASSLGGAVAE